MATNLDKNVLKDLSYKGRNWRSWVINAAPRCTVADGLLMCSDEFLDNLSHPLILVPSLNFNEDYFGHTIIASRACIVDVMLLTSPFRRISFGEI